MCFHCLSRLSHCLCIVFPLLSCLIHCLSSWTARLLYEKDKEVKRLTPQMDTLGAKVTELEAKVATANPDVHDVAARPLISFGVSRTAGKFSLPFLVLF